ncbi:precorrin-2 C(20)-methyltransferase [Motiliproteus coralliicola]|uniref:Precorrin-2 C(20)-methyltransferase n=1 Tax=Motiliproteus coralliicola TaxID=2283196 RepID=A0A369W8E0_9GAMM|nr:precorrin-2 C(20)-methyltransferase [Motiliproteus coralliicola]RDE18260.1 precorrin-2 C(20)-methyltransferase [Motiliproteus coralliicola]
MAPDKKPGCLYGVGVGPGDPELLTVKAWRLIRGAAVLSYLTNEQGSSQALTIAADAVAEAGPLQIQLPIAVSMQTERREINRAYDRGAERIAAELSAGRDVVFLCEGDPLFFGSFSYLLDRLRQLLGDELRSQVVPGISSVNAAASVLQQPLLTQRQSFAVVSGRHSDEQILQALRDHDAVVIMKAGQARPRILQLLAQSGRLDDARYLEYIGREQQQQVDDVRQLADEAGPYFSLFVVLGGIDQGLVAPSSKELN